MAHCLACSRIQADCTAQSNEVFVSRMFCTSQRRQALQLISASVASGGGFAGAAAAAAIAAIASDFGSDFGCLRPWQPRQLAGQPALPTPRP